MPLNMFISSMNKDKTARETHSEREREMRELGNIAMTIILLPSTILLLLVVVPPFLCFKALRFCIRFFRAVNIKDKVVLITGASSGIGKELAYRYAKGGAYLVLVARRVDLLERVAERSRELGSPDVLVLPADVSNPEMCQEVIQNAVNHFGRLDHLVTNAGMGSFCLFEESGDVTRFRKIMDINYWGSVYPTHYALPHLRKSGGKIIVTSSVAGTLPCHGMSFYNASKAALNMFYDTLRLEVGSTVQITIVQPGMIESEIIQGKGMLKGGVEGVDLQALLDISGPVKAASAEECANVIVASASRGDRYMTWPTWYCASYLVSLFIPEMLQLPHLGSHGHSKGKNVNDYNN